MKNLIKDQYILNNNPKNIKDIFSIIIEKIPSSIFSVLNANFFKKMVETKIIDLYLIKKKNKTTSIISVISISNYKILKKKIFLFLLMNPLIILSNINFLIKMVDKSSFHLKKNSEKKYLHLLHLVIISKYFKKISLKKKDNIFNYFFKKIVKKNNASSLFLCYEADNLKAQSYYKRNNFKIYKKINKTFFLKKDF